MTGEKATTKGKNRVSTYFPDMVSDIPE